MKKDVELGRNIKQIPKSITFVQQVLEQRGFCITGFISNKILAEFFFILDVCIKITQVEEY